MMSIPRLLRLSRILPFAAILVFLTACSVELVQTPSPATPTAQVVIGSSTNASPAPSQAAIPQTGAPFHNPNLPSEMIPVSWSDLHLTGKLVFIVSTQKDQSNPVLKIQALDLATGELVTIFQAPENAWIYFLSVSPSSTYVVLGYAPAPVNNQPQGQALYSRPGHRMENTSISRTSITRPCPKISATPPTISGGSRCRRGNRKSWRVPPSGPASPPTASAWPT
jgi:hypothetical protein